VTIHRRHIVAEYKLSTKFIEIVIEENENAIYYAIEEGANVNEQDKNGWSALYYAVDAGNISIIELLLRNGANVDIKDIYGITPLYRAVFNCEGDGSIIKLLLNYGADKYLKNNFGVSPYDLSHIISNYPVSQFLE
jgi:ankyrin repeat protein